MFHLMTSCQVEYVSHDLTVHVADPLNEAAVPEDSKDSLTNKYLDAYNNRAAEIL